MTTNDSAPKSGSKKAPIVSPLAPSGGFPEIPPIDGVQFAAVAAGVRYAGRLDLMLAHVCDGARMAGVFTRSATRSAPVLWCEECLANGGSPAGSSGYAILVNSGNSNAFTGATGRSAVAATVDGTADVLGIPREHVFTASTGVIGEPLQADRITSKLRDLAAELRPDAIGLAARAIMTTDTYAKGAYSSVELDGVPVKIAGIAKGSGMIAPDMATMLVFLFTDAVISQQILQDSVSKAADATFNCITVDGDTSTSDSLLMAATARAAMPEISTSDDPRLAAFQAALHRVMLDLAHQVVRDGEGATKFVEVAVTGAASDADARKVAFSVANSPLVKTAIAGEDPNWGRVVMAVGKSGAAADRDRLTIRFGDILVAEAGQVSPSYTEAAGAEYMRRQNLEVGIDLGLGSGRATVWTCDLTHRYIDINADYRS